MSWWWLSCGTGGVLEVSVREVTGPLRRCQEVGARDSKPPNPTDNNNDIKGNNMSETYFISCDNEGCDETTNPNDYGASVFHKVILGGSDFELSCMSPEERQLDFCSLDCMKEWINKTIQEQNAVE